MRTNFVSIAAAASLVLLAFLGFANLGYATSYTLTIIGNGSGTITADNTNATHPSGSVVTLTASPNTGWYFANWSGDASGTTNPLHVAMTGNLVITGNFLAFPTYSLVLTTNGQGSISLNPTGGSYYSNTTVAATATPAPGWVFTGWSGAASGGGNPIALVVDTNSSLTGTFAELPAFDLQPVSQTNALGSTIGFTTHAVGTAPLAYQWYFSGGSLPASDTNSMLSLTNVSSAAAGNYWVVATNDYGSATSYVASLTLTNSAGPTNLVNILDEGSLRVAIALGGWVGIRFNGTLTITNTITITNQVVLDANNVSATISGGDAVRLFYVANGASLTISNLTLADGYCVITNGNPGTAADGGAIYNDNGSVMLVNCVVTNNAALCEIWGGWARGGAIFNNGGAVSLLQSLVVSNLTFSGGYDINGINGLALSLGGAVFNTNGTVVIAGCTLRGNSSHSYILGTLGYTAGPPEIAMGGVVFQSSGTLVITNSGLVSNQAVGEMGFSDFLSDPAYGGAVAIAGGSSQVDQSRFLANTATGGDAAYHGQAGSAYGGAIYCAGILAVNDSSFARNQCMAGNGTANLAQNRHGADAFGGAIYNSGTALLNRCTMWSNSVVGGSVFSTGDVGSASNGGNALGGGVFNAADLFATNCTVALNSNAGGPGAGEDNYGGADGYGGVALGGGIFNNTNAVFVGMNLTVASNVCDSPSGFEFTNGLAAGYQIGGTNGAIHLHNSIMAYSGAGQDAYGPITDDGYNMCSDGSANFDSGSSYNYTDPQLEPLGNNGGPTLTMALAPDSPAIDTADSTGAPGVDQRGYVRPAGSAPDMGAYEYGAVLLTTSSLAISISGDTVILSFAAYPGSMYYVQSSTDLANWTDVSTNGLFTEPTNVTQTVSKSGLNWQYFRLLVK